MAKEKVKIQCNSCHGSRNHTIIFQYPIDDIINVDGETHFVSRSDYQILQCDGCESVTFRIVDTYPSFLEPDNFGKGFKILPYKSFEKFFPERVNDLLEEKKFAGLPTSLKFVYREVIDGFNIGQRILCAVGLRALVEGVCNHLGIKDRSLNAKITNLQTMGYLGKDLSESLRTHKFLGDKAVHELAVPEKQELKVAIELVEIMMESIFNVPEKHKRLSELMTKRVSKE